MRIKSILLLISLFLVTLSAFPDRQTETRYSYDYNWKKEAARLGIPEQAILRLEQDKFIVLNRFYKQIFEPYTEPRTSYFITTDSVITAYNVLFEESMLLLEMAQHDKLKSLLQYIWSKLPQKSAQLKFDKTLVEEALRHAQIVLGVALKLLGEENLGVSEDIGKIIAEEVKLVEEGRFEKLPDWLAPPEEDFISINYSMFTPTGFYEGQPYLSQYYRAMKWLQKIPFRIKKDEEFLAALSIAFCLVEDSLNFYKREYLPYLQNIQHLLGERDDLDVCSIVSDCQNLDHKTDFNKIQKEFLEDWQENNFSEILDHIREDKPAAATPQIRFLSAFKTPDSLIFQKTTNYEYFPLRPFPSGLELCAALGSQQALEILTKNEKTSRLQEIITNSRSLFEGKSLYHKYFFCLSALLDDSEPDCPEFMKETKWEIKNWQTFLGGWAFIRQSLLLHAKFSYAIGGTSWIPPGFIEPEPEFFSRMADLIKESYEFFENASAFNFNFKSQLKSWVKTILSVYSEMYEKKKFKEEEQKEFLFTLPRQEREAYLEARNKFYYFDPFPPSYFHGDWNDPEDLFTHSLNKLQKIDTEMEGIEQPSVPPHNQKVILFWKKLERVCLKLEALAHKQLRRIPFSEEDHEFILSYGEQLGHIMFYNVNSYLNPRDDAPRIVDVTYNQYLEKYFKVGIGRPAALYVLYPTADGEVLCQGGVLSYYEFPWPQPLTNDAWRELLDSADSPHPPAWLKTILFIEKRKN